MTAIIETTATTETHGVPRGEMLTPEQAHQIMSDECWEHGDQGQLNGSHHLWIMVDPEGDGGRAVYDSKDISTEVTQGFGKANGLRYSDDYVEVVVQADYLDAELADALCYTGHAMDTSYVELDHFDEDKREAVYHFRTF